jgi:hypothetical protein
MGEHLNDGDIQIIQLATFIGHLQANNPPPAEREVLGGPPEGGTVIGKPRWG